MSKLHLGCGDIYLEGWINVDLDNKKADLNCDLREPLPFESSSVDYIYSEHFIEHLSFKDGVKFFKECFRILRPGGVIRVATPDLDYVVFRHFFFWKKQPWIEQYGYGHVKTKAELLNICFREWGHQHLYNREELERGLEEAGFSKISKSGFCKSKHPELRGLETRKESRLILEATK